MRFIYTDGSDQDFIGLCRLLDDYLNEIAGGEENRRQYLRYNTLEDIHDVVVAYDGALAVGCAGFKHYEKGAAEVKRVFVRPAYRGCGVAKRIMGLLEARAREQGYARLLLETGKPLAEALGLYWKIGYMVTENYGQYKGMAESICMQKEI